VPFAISAFALLAGVLAGYVLTAANADWYYSIVPEELAGGRTPTASTEYLRKGLFDETPGDANALSFFATYLFTHNAKIGMMSFALGFAFGLPTVILLVDNGLIMGAFFALYASRGLGFELGGWLFIHGVTELLALILCGAAGLALGGALAFPGSHSRLANLAATGRVAGQVVIGAVALLVIAGLLEGLGRQLITETSLRYAVAATTAMVWLLYFGFAGRNRSHGDSR
jgi:uncharacterized membrane protein SpoIIM required for sporulation